MVGQKGVVRVISKCKEEFSIVSNQILTLQLITPPLSHPLFGRSATPLFNNFCSVLQRQILPAPLKTTPPFGHPLDV